MALPTWVKKACGNTTWYHQRFDGAPLYLFAVGDAETRREKRKPRGTEADVRVSFFNKLGKGDWYLDMRDVKRGAAKIMELARKDHSISKKLLAAWQSDEQTFEKFFRQYEWFDLTSLSNDELTDLIRIWYELFEKRFTSSAIIDHFALGTDQILADLVLQEAKLENPAVAAELFSQLTAPTRQSFINKAEAELMQLALKKNASATELTKHQRRYYWIHNNYFAANVLNEKYFAAEISKLKKKRDLKKLRQALLATPQAHARQKKILIKKYRLSRFLQTMLTVSDDFTWWQDERKRSTFLNIHLGTRLLGEAAKRIKYPVELTKYLLPSELEYLFNQKTRPSIKELRARQTGCGFVITREKTFIATGSQAEELRKFLLGTALSSEVEEVKGLVASVGKAKGRARIISSAREIDRVKRGDILLAVMTRPDYIIGMKKAAAIVTNEGGVTSHAAIVSRELGIPCVIGTKIATEVFKDGDMIEVDAFHGVVRKLKS
jgi:phosphohistidine swiveling domain-containing protein